MTRSVPLMAPFLIRLGWMLPLALLGVTVGCHPQKPPEVNDPRPKTSVHVRPVDQHGLLSTEEVVGTVRAKLRASVESKIAGRIEALLVNPGQAVRKGDVLATLDSREVKARLDSAQAVLEQASRELKRISKLVKDGAATASEEDAAQARYRVATAAAAEAETFLGHAQVVAPFSGVITRKMADVGDLASPGRSLLEIEDPTQLRLEADVAESLLDQVRLGSRFRVRVASLKDTVEGVVSEMAPIAESVSRTYLVKLDLPSVAGLRAGQFGRVAIPTGEAAVPHIPAEAILQRGQLEYVFVTDSGKAQLRLIRTGKRLEAGVEIVSGLNLGEKVVVDDPSRLAEGQPVEVLP